MYRPCSPDRPVSALTYRPFGKRLGSSAVSVNATYLRNAINNGLVAIECDTSSIVEGDQLTVELDGPALRVDVAGRDVALTGASLQPLIRRIIESGGLVAYLEREERFGSAG